MTASVRTADLFRAEWFHYWGKAKPAEQGAAFHYLPYHCLDVAAVAQQLWHGHAGLRAKLVGLTGWPEAQLESWLVAFAALHDLGKFAHAFQAQRPEIAAQLGLDVAGVDYQQEFRHDRLGASFWNLFAYPLLKQERLSHSTTLERLYEAPIMTWAECATCHHGQPQSLVTSQGVLQKHFGDAGLQAATSWGRWVLQVFSPLQLLEFPDRKAGEHRKALNKASWLLAGVFVLCDWIGSNAAPEGFPYCDQPVQGEAGLLDYWRYAQQRASQALADFGVLPCAVDKAADFTTLFPNLSGKASPLQQRVCELPLAPGPALYLIEDVTGAGKTEAALMLALRLMQAGQGDGLYIGLPTMATANAMYIRLGKHYRAFYQAEAKPSLALAHSARQLSDEFRQACSRSQPDDFANADEGSASSHCNAWIADSRKKTFFADMGVGTLDQALLGVLPSKHQSLRLLGLSSRLLICDEVHSWDDYSGGLLKALLHFQASLGGSAILLSATLSRRQQLEFIAAFRSGLGAAKPIVEAPDEEILAQHFPALSSLSATDGLQCEQLPTRPDVARSVKVQLQHEQHDVLQLLLAEVQAGRCACWVRNTVADVMAAWQLLHSLPELAGRVEIFHARYCLADRLEIEGWVLARYGRDAEPGLRQGRILLATQVVEQSLDLDFDLMVSDIAPIDLLIQRAGRIKRHRRDLSGRLQPGSEVDQRGQPVLHVYCPPPVSDPAADWLSETWRGTGFVYADHAQLWRTARLLERRGGWTMPQDARDLIREGIESDEVPAGLRQNNEDAEGKALCRMSLAFSAALTCDVGYSEARNRFEDERKTPTRLVEPTQTVWLLRWQDGALQPWRDAANLKLDEPSLLWDCNAVSLRENLFLNGPSKAPWAQALQALQAELPAKGQYGKTLVLEWCDGAWRGEGIDSKHRRRSFVYGAMGLQLERTEG